MLSIPNLEILEDGELAEVSPLNNNFETIRVAVNNVASTASNMVVQFNNLNNNVNNLSEKIDYIKLPVGTKLELFAELANPEDYRLMLCDWSAVSRTVYSDLFKMIGTRYGTGDGTTTFNLPNCMNGATSRGYNPGLTEDIGKTQEGGLPNIVGSIWHKSFNGHNLQAHSWGGALSYAGVTSAMMRTEGGGSFNTGILIDASKSSELYGASPNEVRIKNYAVYVYIRY